MELSHVAPPPKIGSREVQRRDDAAFFNRVTLAGIDMLTPDPYFGPDGRQHRNLDYIQFINPGDLRVVSAGRGCGMQGCHATQHARWVPRSMIATTTGLFSATRFSVGVDNRVPESRTQRDGNSLADSAPRPVDNPDYTPATAAVGEVARLVAQPEWAQFDGAMRDNGNYIAANLGNHIINGNQDPQKPNRVRKDSPLEVLIDEQVNITCGNCHLWSAGANDRYASFRSSGCTACHMEYSYDGRYGGSDPNVQRCEPADPDQIAPGERAHTLTHQIRNVAKILPNGAFIRGISDRACVSCHLGSNATVLQYWGIRVDEGRDVTRRVQYPANPDAFDDAAEDKRLFDREVRNSTFGGRVASQHLLMEDYDADGRDDTPPDIHYEAGLGCIDCHGSRDLHGGTAGDRSSGQIRSRQDQVTQVACETCHGWVNAYAATEPCETYPGDAAECVIDRQGNPLRHVTKDAQGHYWLVSRLTGDEHYLPQIRDLTVISQRTHPGRLTALYSPKASYAMGRADYNPETGTGPLQDDGDLFRVGFSHLDTLDCAACHAAWTNSCIGCHLATQYDASAGAALFSNITGERILLRELAADPVYQSPVMQYLGVNSRGRITKVSPAEKAFWRFVDFDGHASDVFAFSDRLGEGNNPALNGRNDFPAIALNQMSPHSIRGKVDADNEGPTYCVGCHLNVAMQSDERLMARYAEFVAAYDRQDFASIDFDVLRDEIGRNTGNQRNSPLYVRMVAGLGTGLFLFDDDGCPVNPLDERTDRPGCGDAPASVFANRVDAVRYDLDRLVEASGQPNVSSSHPRLTVNGVERGGASNDQMGGPLGTRIIHRLVGGDDIERALFLDAWLDADGRARGEAPAHVGE